MVQWIVSYLPWLLSLISIWMTVMAGNKHPNAWLIGLGNQLLWLVWILCANAWGFIPLNAMLWIAYGRNHLKWKRENLTRHGNHIPDTGGKRPDTPPPSPKKK